MSAEQIPQSATIRVPLQAFLASDHITPATGKTIAITISKNGASYGNPSGGATNATEIGSGSYYVDLSTTDTGTIGTLFVKGTEGTIDQVIAIYDVADPNNAGFAGVPAHAANAAGGLPVSIAGGLDLDEQNADIEAIQTSVGTLVTGTNVTQINGNSNAAANLGVAYAGFEIGTAQTGTLSSITIRSGAVGTTNYWANQAIYLTGGTGGGQTNKITSSLGQVLTVETPWVITPDNTTTYIVLGRIG